MNNRCFSSLTTDAKFDGRSYLCLNVHVHPGVIPVMDTQDFPMLRSFEQTLTCGCTFVGHPWPQPRLVSAKKSHCWRKRQFLGSSLRQPVLSARIQTPPPQSQCKYLRVTSGGEILYNRQVYMGQISPSPRLRAELQAQKGANFASVCS